MLDHVYVNVGVGGTIFGVYTNLRRRDGWLDSSEIDNEDHFRGKWARHHLCFRRICSFFFQATDRKIIKMPLVTE